jgi:hypothetical protein
MTNSTVLYNSTMLKDYWEGWIFQLCCILCVACKKLSAKVESLECFVQFFVENLRAPMNRWYLKTPGNP